MSAATVTELLLQAACERDRGPAYLDDQLRADAWSFERLAHEARAFGAHLQKLDIQPGDTVAIIAPDPKDFIVSFYGSILAGAVPVPMASPRAMTTPVGFIEAAVRILRIARCKAIASPTMLAGLTAALRQETGVVHIVDPRAYVAGEGHFTAVRTAPSDPCFLQFTSGSTSDPKGVIVSHENVIANCHAIMIDGLKSNEQDRGISWLPLYHDMGLVGFVIAPLITRCTVLFLPTLSFVRRPPIWMRAVSEHRGTVSFAPNFAFSLATRRARNLEQLDLSCLRVLGCGAEPIDACTLDAFIEAHLPAGLRPESVTPAYGLAEATLAVSFGSSHQRYSSLAIDRELYEREGRVRRLEADVSEARIVGCGRVLPGHEVEIRDPRGEPQPEDVVGEIVVRGPSCTRGYFGEASSERREVSTGDLGFIHEGELFISGRLKDLLIIGGRNYFPQDIEQDVERVGEVRSGTAIAFTTPGMDGVGQLVILAEANSGEGLTLADAVRKRIMDVHGLSVHEVCVLKRGAVTKTSSGKLQRSKARRQWHEGDLQCTARFRFTGLGGSLSTE